MAVIKIEAVAERQTKRGERFLEVRLADGKVAYVFDKTLFGAVKPGVIEAELSDGRWPKITAVRVPNGQAGQAEPDRLRLLARSSALQAAVELAKLRGEKASTEWVLKAAEVLLGWLVQD